MKNNILLSARQNQKLRTKEKILESARQLLAQGKDYTLADLAARAQVSRATIYRYYSNIDVLYAEAVLELHSSKPDLVLQGLKGSTLVERLLEVQDFYNTLVMDNEPAFRKYLSIVVNSTAAQGVAGNRRLEHWQSALSPGNIPLTEEETRLLLHLASILTGIEPITVTKGVCGLPDAAAKETLQWGLQMVLKGMFHK